MVVQERTEIPPESVVTIELLRVMKGLVPLIVILKPVKESVAVTTGRSGINTEIDSISLGVVSSEKEIASFPKDFLAEFTN
jgi:hypothetical protein